VTITTLRTPNLNSRQQQKTILCSASKQWHQTNFISSEVGCGQWWRKTPSKLLLLLLLLSIATAQYKLCAVPHTALTQQCAQSVRTSEGESVLKGSDIFDVILTVHRR